MGKLMRRAMTRADFKRAAKAYLAGLPLEHFMEAVPQATQRKITLESFDVIRVARPDVRAHNELLLQEELEGELVQVVPDNLVLLSEEELDLRGSYDLNLHPVRPLLVLEYVSRTSKRKDYEGSFQKYERRLRVPYCLIFDPDQQDLRVWRLGPRGRYRRLPENAQNRAALPELELEVGLLGGWVRYWFRGKLVPLPADLQREADAARQEAERQRRRADDERRRADDEKRRADDEKRRADEAEAEIARLRQLLAQARQGRPPGA